MKKAVILIMVIMLLAFSGCKSEQNSLAGEVNGEKITMEEYKQRVELLKISYQMRQKSIQYASGDIKDFRQVKIDEKTMQELENSAFDFLVIEKLLLKEADRWSITASDQDINAEIDEFKQQQTAIAGENGYSDFLSDLGLTEEQFKEEIRKGYIREKLFDSIAQEAGITENEVREYYEANIDMYQKPAGIQISHVLVQDENKARELIARLEQGADFAALASENSTCPSKDKGGDLGIINESIELLEEFKDAALALSPGEMSREPVKSEVGYHIIKAGKRQEAGPIPFEEVSNDILTQLENQFYNQYVEQMYSSAEIKDYRK